MGQGNRIISSELEGATKEPIGADEGVMRKSESPSTMDYFADLAGPRIDRCQRHKLLDIVAIAICGADSWV